MAKECIEREAAIKRLYVTPVKTDEDGYSWILLRDAFRAIDETPAADVVPVRHGRWVHPAPGDGEPYCSVCRAEADYFYGYGSFEPDFCPNCGARMDGDGE